MDGESGSGNEGAFQIFKLSKKYAKIPIFIKSKKKS